MHSAFTRQFIFELIPFIILFTTRELKFIDIESASNFFNSVIGRSMIGMIAFTFATYTLSSVTPNKIGTSIVDPINMMRLNSFTNIKDNNINLLHGNPKQEIESFEKYITYATI